MSELDYEQSPSLEVHVPRVRNWWTPLRYGMGRALLRMPRHVWVPLWFLPILWMLTLFLAAALWALALALLIPYAIWAFAELLTYNKRCERALASAWTEYMIDVNDKDRP